MINCQYITKQSSESIKLNKEYNSFKGIKEIKVYNFL